jgi:hypothetical protein
MSDARPLLKVAFGLLLFACGCTGTGIPVRITPVQSHKTLGINFTRAYYAPTQSGEDQIVLVSDPIDEAVTAAPGKPLPELRSAPIWYVLLIDLHWRNAAPGGADSPVYRNASLHFYVCGNSTEQSSTEQSSTEQTSTQQSAAVLHYSGTGSVGVSADKTGASVSVQSGEMTLIEQHGQLVDPFKRFHIDTEFHAVTDTARLEEVMADVQKAITEAEGRATTKPG